MDKEEFAKIRQKLKVTQEKLAQLLGISTKAVQSFEQGWRKVPPYVERQVLFLWIMKCRASEKVELCWEIKDCPEVRYINCPAWEFNCGHLCWFINGTICQGVVRDWPEKMECCRYCEVLASAMEKLQGDDE